MKRRKFLQNSALATGGSMLIPGFLKALELSQMNQTTIGGKKLVIIQWSGGNDGLNTVVPVNNDLYYKNRPQLALAKNDVLSLNDELGLNPVMKGLKEIYDQGYLSIINNVGYPNPDRSHFRSMDIWHTASDSNEYLNTGWLGRYLDAQCSHDCQSAHQVLEVDDTLSLALKGEQIKGLALQNPQKLFKLTQEKHIQKLNKVAKDHHEEDSQVSYLYKTLAETVSSADYIYDKSKTYKSKLSYPASQFSKQLKTIAELINSGVDTSVYYASISGFDTHVNQKPQQQRLLKMYAEAMQVFVKDLKENGNLNDTIIMTFSEFGRRVAQNASRGTDHGTANNVFIIGGKLKKTGVYNELPNLSDLDQGDLKYTVDFRSIYTTLLEKQLGFRAEQILGKRFSSLGFV